MPSIAIQFHATLEELADFAERWLSDYSIHAVVVEYTPYVARPVGVEDVRREMARDRVRRIAFTVDAPDCAASGNNQFLDKNEGALLLDIGRVGPRGLTGSSISTNSVVATWRKIAANVRAETRAGVVGTNEDTGASARYRQHRYTKGALGVLEGGVPLRAFERSSVVFRPAE